jgi:hypothetical protein
MDSIATARDFFINQQGLSPDQADMIVSQGLQAYNQQAQPQSMMQMASGGIARLGYQLGGLSTMPMDYGQSLQVPQQQPQPNFSSATNITMNPLASYGQPELGQAGGTPLMMRGGGIARLGYQMGGEAGMNEMAMPQMNEQQALETIIQLLIEQGIDPETALQLAAQILQIFAQGGEPAVEAFADQLEQQEQAEAMAGGGIAGYAQRQNYGFGSFVSSVAKGITGAVKGVAKAVKSVAKSPIGRIALTIGANMLLPGAGSAFGAALKAAAINLGVQAIAGGKINPLEALAAGATGYIGFGGAPTGGETMYTDYSDALSKQYANVGLQNPTTTPLVNNQALRNITTNPLTDTGGESAYTNYGDRLSRVNETFSDRVGDTVSNVKTGIQNLYKDPLGTIKSFGTSAMDLIEKNPKTAAAVAFGTGVGTGIAFGAPKQENESDEDFAKRQQEEANLSLTQLGRNLGIRNPYFYQRYGAVDPFAVQTAADGGIMGYARGGSMVPPARQIEGGIIELDARKTGGYIPYGKKERVDDVPAMLAKDEFVFTSRAVKAAGGGSARRGAAKMYKLMKQLESKGMKMERGARA